MSFFVKEVLNEESGNYFELTGMGYGALVAIMIGILLAACFVSGRKEEEKSGVRQLIFSSMAMALAMVTSMIKIADLPMGGSATLFSMLFVCLIGYWYGLKGGIFPYRHSFYPLQPFFYRGKRNYH